jgi:hypothetical protein
MHPGADEFFKKIMSQPVEQTGTTSYYQSPQYKALSYLSYNADQETATKRKVLLESVRPSVTDEKLKSLLDSTGRRLDYRINPKTYQWKGKSGSGGGAAIEGRQLFFNQGGGGLLLQGSGPDGQSSTIRILPAGGKKQSLPRRGPAIEHNHVRRLVFVAAQPEVLALFADARED